MCWNCGMVVPVLDVLADILGIERGVYWLQDSGPVLAELLTKLRGEEVHSAICDDIVSEFRIAFPNMPALEEAKRLALSIDMSEYTRSYYVFGIPDKVCDEWKRNMCDRFEQGMLLVADHPPPVFLKVYRFSDPTKRKPCASLSKFEYPELIDQRYYRPDPEKIP